MRFGLLAILFVATYAANLSYRLANPYVECENATLTEDRQKALVQGLNGVRSFFALGPRKNQKAANMIKLQFSCELSGLVERYMENCTCPETEDGNLVCDPFPPEDWNGNPAKFIGVTVKVEGDNINDTHQLQIMEQIMRSDVTNEYTLDRLLNTSLIHDELTHVGAQIKECGAIGHIVYVYPELVHEGPFYYKGGELLSDCDPDYADTITGLCNPKELGVVVPETTTTTTTTTTKPYLDFVARWKKLRENTTFGPVPTRSSSFRLTPALLIIVSIMC